MAAQHKCFHLRKFGDISDALLHLGEEGCHLLELLQLEESIAGGVLVQDEVWGHDGSYLNCWLLVLKLQGWLNIMNFPPSLSW